MKIADRRLFSLICGAIIITLSVYYTVPIAQTSVLFVGMADYHSNAWNINGEYIEPQDLPEFASALLEYYDIIVIEDDALTELHKSQTQALRDYQQGGGAVYIIGNTHTDFSNNIDIVQLDTILEHAGGIGLPRFFLFDIYYGIIPAIISGILLGYGIPWFRGGRKWKKPSWVLYSVLFVCIFYRLITNLYYLQIGPLTRTEDPTMHILLTELLIRKPNVMDFAPVVIDTPLAYPIGFHALCALLSVLLGVRAFTIVINAGAILSAMLPLPMYLLGVELQDEYTGLATAYISAILPWIFTIFAFGLYSNILGYIFFALMFYSLLRGIERKSMRQIILAGIFFGILILVHLILSMSVIVILGVFAVLLILQKRTIRSSELYAIMIIVLIAIPVSLFWTSRGFITLINNIVGGYGRVDVTSNGFLFLRFDFIFFLQNLVNYIEIFGVFIVCILIGILISFKQRTSKDLFLLSWIVPLFVLTSCFGFPLFHFYRGLVLAMCVVGGYGFRNLPYAFLFIQSKIEILRLIRVDERILAKWIFAFMFIVSLYHSMVAFHIESKEMYLDEAHALTKPTDATIRAAIWLSNYDPSWCRLIVVPYENPWVAVYAHKIPMEALISDIENLRGINQQKTDRDTILNNLSTSTSQDLLQKYNIGYFLISDYYEDTYDQYDKTSFLKLIYEKDSVRIYAVSN
ncbi:MAG: glycosyltransferase family 39 protein [Candidatus Sifarchaeia archaeon]|jgi:hypothetical protein